MRNRRLGQEVFDEIGKLANFSIRDPVRLKLADRLSGGKGAHESGSTADRTSHGFSKTLHFFNDLAPFQRPLIDAIRHQNDMQFFIATGPNGVDDLERSLRRLEIQP